MAHGPSSRWRVPPGLGDHVFRGASLLLACAVLGLILLIFIQLLAGSGEALARFGLGFLTSTTWDPVNGQFGALPFLYGTLVSSLLALLVGGPISLGVAIYLAELAPSWLRSPVSFLVELLAAIPSVVYGLWGIFVLAPVLRSAIEPGLASALGFLPLFRGPFYGVGMLAAGLILAIMVVPTITAVSRDAIAAVPMDQREAMLALGAIRGAVLPYARSGIIGAFILGLGRALGETMAVIMVIGNRPEISVSLFAPAYTMASVIANEFTEATYDLYLSALIEIGLVLFIVTVLLNATARLLVWRVAIGPTGGE